MSRLATFLPFARPPKATASGAVGHWSNATTWGGSKPIAGDNVTVGSGNTVVLDESTPSLGTLTIAGTLRVLAGARVKLTAKRILITATGRLEAGTIALPFNGDLVVELTGPKSASNTVARYVADDIQDGGTIVRTGTGNGLARQLFAGAGAQVGIYTITFGNSATNPQPFTVTGPSAYSANGEVGIWFDGQITFLFQQGGTQQATNSTYQVEVRNLGFVNDGTQRSIIVESGGVLSLVGDGPSVPWTRLSDHLGASSVSAAVRAATGWGPHDELCISGTDFFDAASNAGLSVKNWSKSRSGNTVTLCGSVGSDRWGKIQYVTDAGMSLTAGTLTRPSDAGNVATYISAADWADIPKTLDEAAFVGNLTRNIEVRGVDDSDWQSSSFGVHTMVMGLTSTYILKNVRFSRCGQAGAIGRYPIHLHMLSYGGQRSGNMNLPSDGTYLGDVDPTKIVIENNAIVDSGQRAIVVHGTCGATVKNNIAYNFIGHGIFLEDSSERRNVIDGNLLMKFAAPSAANKLIITDRTATPNFGGSAGIWFSNPENTITNNAVLSGPVGIWDVTGTPRSVGLCREVAVTPSALNLMNFSDNVAACTGTFPFLREFPHINTFHDQTVTHYANPEWLIQRNTAYKGKDGAYRNRPAGSAANQMLARYETWTAADSEQILFSGAGIYYFPMLKSLLVGDSLNNATSRYSTTRGTGITSYDNGFEVRSVIGVSFPLELGPGSESTNWGNIVLGQNHSAFMRVGEYTPAMAAYEYYYGWKLIGSHPGGLIKPNIIDGVTPKYHKGSNGIVYDYNGVFTGTAGNFIVYDHAYYTWDNATLTAYHAGAKVSTTKYVGADLERYEVGTSGVTRQGDMPIRFIRYDPASPSTNVGEWAMPDTGTGGLDHFRDTAFIDGGLYKVDWYSEIPTERIDLRLYYAHTPSTLMFTIGIQWSNSVPVESVYLMSSALNSAPQAGDIALNKARAYNSTGMTSLADVMADTTGTKFWQDTTNNVVWCRVKCGLAYPDYGTGDYELRRERSFGMKLVVHHQFVSVT